MFLAEWDGMAPIMAPLARPTGPTAHTPTTDDTNDADPVARPAPATIAPLGGPNSRGRYAKSSFAQLLHSISQLAVCPMYLRASRAARVVMRGRVVRWHGWSVVEYEMHMERATGYLAK